MLEIHFVKKVVGTFAPFSYCFSMFGVGLRYKKQVTWLGCSNFVGSMMIVIVYEFKDSKVKEDSDPIMKEFNWLITKLHR